MSNNDSINLYNDLNLICQICENQPCIACHITHQIQSMFNEYIFSMYKDEMILKNEHRIHSPLQIRKQVYDWYINNNNQPLPLCVKNKILEMIPNKNIYDLAEDEDLYTVNGDIKHIFNEIVMDVEIIIPNVIPSSTAHLPTLPSSNMLCSLCNCKPCKILKYGNYLMSKLNETYHLCYLHERITEDGDIMYPCDLQNLLYETYKKKKNKESSNYDSMTIPQ